MQVDLYNVRTMDGSCCCVENNSYMFAQNSQLYSTSFLNYALKSC